MYTIICGAPSMEQAVKIHRELISELKHMKISVVGFDKYTLRLRTPNCEIRVVSYRVDRNLMGLRADTVLGVPDSIGWRIRKNHETSDPNPTWNIYKYILHYEKQAWLNSKKEEKRNEIHA